MARGRTARPKETEKGLVSPAKTNSDAPPAKKSRQSKKLTLEVPKLPQKSGNLLACGQNDVGQLGFHPDDVAEKARPAIVAEIKDVVDVQAGGMHSLCLTRKGEIWSFGCNDEGALGRDTSEEGSETKPTKIDLPKKAVRISCGDSHSACLLEDGSVFAWGSFRDAHGSMGLTTEGKKQSPIQVLPGIVAVDIASGSDHFVVLSTNGSVYTIGCGEQGQLGRASMRTLTGESRRGTKTLLTPGAITKRARDFVADAVWATPYCTFMREASSGSVYGFGLNNYYQISVKKGKNEFEHFPVLTKMQNVKQIAGGSHHTIVLTNDNQVYSIGRKEYGRLGLGQVSDDIAQLTLIEELKDKYIVKISCGAENSFGLTADGKLYVWGSGTSSTLGTGDEDDVETPKLLVSAQLKEKNVLAISGGGQHTLFLVEAPVSEPEETVETSKVKKSVSKDSVKKGSEDQKTEPTGSDGSPSKAAAVAKEPSVDSAKSEEMEVDEASGVTTDVNGNNEKEEKTDESAPAKRARKRKA